ncbi:unnamed protein product, partial [Amoebophrya sp. A25]
SATAGDSGGAGGSSGGGGNVFIVATLPPPVVGDDGGAVATLSAYEQALAGLCTNGTLYVSGSGCSTPTNYALTTTTTSFFGLVGNGNGTSGGNPTTVTYTTTIDLIAAMSEALASLSQAGFAPPRN